MKWPWKDGGYCKKDHGEYSVTKHPVETRDSLFYIAWHKQTELGCAESFADAEGICLRHADTSASR